MPAKIQRQIVVSNASIIIRCVGSNQRPLPYHLIDERLGAESGPLAAFMLCEHSPLATYALPKYDIQALT